MTQPPAPVRIVTVNIGDALVIVEPPGCAWCCSKDHTSDTCADKRAKAAWRDRGRP